MDIPPTLCIIRLVILSLLFSATPSQAASGAIPDDNCSDIQKTDFRNSQINIPRTLPPPFALPFHDGEVLSYDHDALIWRATIEQDRFVELNGNMPIRVLLIRRTSNHEAPDTRVGYVVAIDVPRERWSKYYNAAARHLRLTALTRTRLL